MRRLAVLAAVVILAGACSAAPDFVVTEGPVADNIVPPAETASTGTPTPVPGATPAKLLPDPERATPEIPLPGERAEYLLTESDLPGWQYGRPMDFSAEPTFESSDCDLMNQAWGAHAQPGTRIRAGGDAVNLRQTVAEMPDAANAGAVLDAADRVWQECVQFDVDGSTWWVEPIEMPEAGEWRATAIAIGLDDNSVWIIGYWQLDNRIVFVDINGDHPWNTADLILQAVAGRLTGAPIPAPAPTPDVPVVVQASPTPQPLPTPTSRPIPTPRPDWRHDALAHLIPEPGEIGPGWEVDGGTVVSREPGGDQEIPGCDIPSPVTPPGIEVTFDRRESLETIEVQVMSGTAEEAAAWPSSFRALAGCDISESWSVEMVEIEADVEGADDAAVLEAQVGLGDIPDIDGADLATHAFFAVASFDGLIVGVLWIDEEDGASIDDVTELIELVASKR